MDAQKIFPIVVAGLIVSAIGAGCSAQPQAARVTLASPTAVAAAPQPIAAPTATAGGPSVPKKSFKKGVDKVQRNLSLEHANPNAQFNAVDLPTDVPDKPPSGKGFNKVVTLLIEPQVTIGGSAATEFKPPLKIIVEFTAQDAAAAGRDKDNKPRLLLGSVYKDGNAWKWQTFQTSVTCTNPGCTEGTLTADISNLRAGDPVFEGDY